MPTTGFLRFPSLLNPSLMLIKIRLPSLLQVASFAVYTSYFSPVVTKVHLVGSKL